MEFINFIRALAVHPRVCGEQVMQHYIRTDYSGSSPRVRGTAGAVNCARRTRRFIPACAGNSAPAKASSVSATVHPRVCGEKLYSLVLTLYRPGSSPRVRGTGTSKRRTVRTVRFIPACAGNRLNVKF